MARRPLTVPTSGTAANAEDYGDSPTPLAVWVTPDGFVVGGPGAWQQLSSLIPQAYTANWAVPDWYIDGVAGLDTNNGTTAATPLRTGAELLRRLGPYALWGQSVTVHVLANGTVDAVILRGVMMVAGTHLDVLGTPNVLATDTIGSYAALNHATPVATQITGTAIVDWTPYQWRRIRITAGVRAEAVSWIATASPAGVGVATGRIAVPAQVNLTSATTNLVSVAFVAGDPFAVERLPFIPALTIALDGPLLTTLGPQYDRRQFSVRNLDVGTLLLNVSAATELYKNIVFGNVFEGISQNGVPRTSPTIPISASLLRSTDPATTFRRIEGSFNNCLFGDGSAAASFGNQVGLFNCLFQGRPIQTNSVLQLIGLQIFDVPGAASNALIASAIVASNSISGSGNAGFGIVVPNGSICVLGGTNNLQAAVSAARLSAAPAINLSLAQFLQPSDYAQKGTSGAMIAGTITITVPWYDNVNQKVTVTHAAFAGTPGILSVQQISNTQFTITSSNALDTSTVNWSISPLGRNIFISTT